MSSSPKGDRELDGRERHHAIHAKAGESVEKAR